MTTGFKEAAELNAALGHPLRLEALFRLLSGRKTVSQLLGYVTASQPSLSQHLAKLRAAGIVKTEREGQRIYYSITGKRYKNIVRCLGREFGLE